MKTLPQNVRNMSQPYFSLHPRYCFRLPPITCGVKNYVFNGPWIWRSVVPTHFWPKVFSWRFEKTLHACYERRAYNAIVRAAIALMLITPANSFMGMMGDYISTSNSAALSFSDDSNVITSYDSVLHTVGIQTEGHSDVGRVLIY